MKKKLTLLLCFFMFGISGLYAQLDFNILNKPISYAVNLDSLARTGTSKAMPVGWVLYQSNGRQTYRANIGDSATANVYSFGTATGAASRIRALGSISTKADTCYFGVEFENNTGFAINTLTIAYTVEQWRLGASGRGADTTEFDFSSNAGSLTGGGTWNHVSFLDMISPVTKGTVGALNGNTAVNQSKVSYKLSGLNIPNRTHFWLRWYDHVIKGPNDGLALQALTLTAYSTAAGPTVVTKINAGKFPQTAGIPDTTVYGKFHGIVLSPNFVSNGGLQFSIRDTVVKNGLQAGIGAITCISATDLNGYKVNIGDSVYVTGKIRSYRYLTYIQLDTLKILKANAGPNPVSITANTISDNNESNLITLNNLSLTPTAKWDTTGAAALGGFLTTARSAFGTTVNIFINKNSNIFLRQKPNFPFKLTGIAMQNSATANAGYFIWPRFASDFDTLAQPKIPLRAIGEVNQYYSGAIALLYGRADSTNKKFFVKGVVHSPDLYDQGLYFNLIDNTGAITVYNVALVDGYSPRIGDSILVRGTILQMNGLIVIAPDSIKVLPKGSALTAPLTTAAPIVKTMESYLLTIKGAKIVDPINWDSTKAANLDMFEVKIAVGKDTFFMDIAKTTDLFRKSVISGIFNVTGVVGEYSTNVRLPYNDHYTIIPRGAFDIFQGKIPGYTIGQIKPYDPTKGIADSLGVTCFLKGVVQSGNINDTGAVAFGLADNTGAITVANLANASAYVPTTGDSITLLGTVSQVNGLTIFIPDSIAKTSTGNTILSPVVITTLDENHESALVTLQGYTMLDPNQWDNLLPANKYGFNVQFVRGNDTVAVHISDNVTDLFNLPYSQKPVGKVDITGMELQKTKLAKAPFANYYIVPRMVSDFNGNSGIEPDQHMSTQVSIYPNPVSGLVHIASSSAIGQICLSDISGRQILTVNAREGNTNMTLNISSLKPGIYILQVSNAEGNYIQKLIRQ